MPHFKQWSYCNHCSLCMKLDVLLRHIPAQTLSVAVAVCCVCVGRTEWMEPLRDSSQHWAKHPGNLIVFMNNKTSIVKTTSALTHFLLACLAGCTDCWSILYLLYDLFMCVCCLTEGRWCHCPANKATFFYPAEMPRCSNQGSRVTEWFVSFTPFFQFASDSPSA